ncbi:hypothetical protein Gotur_001878 [Gossypium turneri]
MSKPIERLISHLSSLTRKCLVLGIGADDSQKIETNVTDWTDMFELTLEEICGTRIAEKVVQLKVVNNKDLSSPKHRLYHYSHVFQTETKALYERLKFAWDLGFHNIEVESDNALQIDIDSSGGAVDSGFTELRLVHEMCKRPPLSTSGMLATT